MSLDDHRTQLLIDGELRDATSGATFTTLNPATEEILGEAADASGADVDAAIAAARRCFDTTTWSTDVAWRVRCIRQLHDNLVARADALRALTTAEVGAPAFLVTGPQFDLPVGDLRWIADLAESYDGWIEDLGYAEPVGVPTNREVWREPVGVVAAITPWNFPHQINLSKVAPALAAGCTVVLKAAPDTPWCAAALAEAAAATELPPGALNILTSSDHAIGAQLTADPRVDLISFTGSTATGKKVMAAASDRIARVFLELGGKSAFVVLDDADFASALGLAAFTACTHAGQGCALTTRLLLPQSRFDEGVELAAATMAMLPSSDPSDPGTVCGPVVSALQRDRVESYLRLATDEGGEFVVGGTRPERHERGFFVDPALVVGLDNNARTAREEIFGPVLVAIPYADDDDAVAIANDSPYGLSGAVWSADLDRARTVARRIRTGTLSINGGVWYSGDAPFGGFKMSGIGREMGRAGFEEYLELKTIATGA